MRTIHIPKGIIMFDLNHATATIAKDFSFNTAVRNKSFELVHKSKTSDITDDEKQYVLETLYCYHAAVELLRDDLADERNKSFIAKLKDLFR